MSVTVRRVGRLHTIFIHGVKTNRAFTSREMAERERDVIAAERLANGRPVIWDPAEARARVERNERNDDIVNAAAHIIVSLMIAVPLIACFLH